jgi:hypothetical protein
MPLGGGQIEQAGVDGLFRQFPQVGELLVDRGGREAAAFEPPESADR